MQHYELLYIITGKFTEEEIEPIASKINELIEKSEGKITLSENLGRKKLAYPIKHNHNGYYQLVEFDLEPQKLIGFEKKLGLTSEVLRHQVVKKKLKTQEEITKEKEIAEKIVKKQKEEEIKEEIKEKAPAKEKMKLEDLDKKLDELLEGEDII